MNGLGAATGADLIAIDPDFCAGLFAELLSFSRDEPGVTRAAYARGRSRPTPLCERPGSHWVLKPECDAAGNLFLTMVGRDPALSPWMVGSHVDTVRTVVNFDGAAGVIGGLAALEALRRAGLVPTRPVTVAVFRAEESVWFPASYVGSRAAFGLLPPTCSTCPAPIPAGACATTWLSSACGRRLWRGASGSARPDADPTVLWNCISSRVRRWRRTGSPVGFVTAISGSFRYRKAACFGRYGHSGAGRAVRAQ